MTSALTGSGTVGERIGQFVAASRWDTLPQPLRHEGKRSAAEFFRLCRWRRPNAADRHGDARPDLIVRSRPGHGARPPGEARPAGRGIRQRGRRQTCSTTTTRICGPSSTPPRRLPRPHSPLRNSAGCPGRRCCTPSSWAPKSNAGSATPSRPAITRAGGTSPRHAACSAPLWRVRSCWDWTRQQTSHAIGIAASQSAGLVENLPSAAKNVSVGNAARNGLFAALLAEQGYTAAPAAIEGALGWARAMGDNPAVARNDGRPR